jgi:phosphatidylserine synthase 1
MDFFNYYLQEYGVNCSDISIERIWSHLDVFAWGHFLGWMFKAILVRHFGILWAISVMWEFTEVSRTVLLSSIEFLNAWLYVTSVFTNDLMHEFKSF